MTWEWVVYNVYQDGVISSPHNSMQSAEWAAHDARFYGARLVCRIVCRSKPEGAPRRYRDEAEKRAWEIYPHKHLSAVRSDFAARYRQAEASR